MKKVSDSRKKHLALPHYQHIFGLSENVSICNIMFPLQCIVKLPYLENPIKPGHGLIRLSRKLPPRETYGMPREMLYHLERRRGQNTSLEEKIKLNQHLSRNPKPYHVFTSLEVAKPNYTNISRGTKPYHPLRLSRS